MSVVYLIEMVGHDLVKIGKTTNVSARLSTLQTGSPYELRLFAVFCGKAECGNGELEESLHHSFAHLRIRGEWFKFTDEIRALKGALDEPHVDEAARAEPELPSPITRSAFDEKPEDFCVECGRPIGREPEWQGIFGVHFACPEASA